MNPTVRSHNCVVLNQYMPTERGSVRKDRVVSDSDIVSYVRVCREQVIRADRCHHAAALCAPMNSYDSG